MRKMCDLREDMARITRRLGLIQEQLNHAQRGFILAAKANDEGEMEAARDRVRNCQERLFQTIEEAYRNLDDQFEASMEDEEDEPPPLH